MAFRQYILMSIMFSSHFRRSSCVGHAKAVGEGGKRRNDQVASLSTLVHTRSLRLALEELQAKGDGQFSYWYICQLPETLNKA